MKNLASIVFLFLVSVNADAQYSFQRQYGGTGQERCESLFSTFDNGFIVNGATTSFGTGNVDAFVLKTDAHGVVQWAKCYGTAAYDNSSYAIETFDHRIVCIGVTYALPSATTSDALLFKSDTAGNLLWTKTYGGAMNEYIASGIELPDHGYALVGATDGYGAGSKDILFIRTNVNGDTLFTRVYGSSQFEIGNSIASVSDSGFIICGKSAANSLSKAMLVRTNASGDLLWAKTYGDTIFQEAWSVKQTPDGGFIVCGSRYGFGAGGYDILLFKTDSSGNVQWSKMYGGLNEEASYTVLLNPDGSYVLSGYTNSMGYGHQRGDDSTNIFLMKTDANGDTIWTRTFGDSLQDEAFLCEKAADGGYLVAGFTEYHTSDSTQMLVIKTDSLGFTDCNYRTSHPIISNPPLPWQSVNYNQVSGIGLTSVLLTETNVAMPGNTRCIIPVSVNEAMPENNFQVYPNPANDKLYLTGNALYERLIKLEVFNSIGEKFLIPSSFKKNAEYFELNIISLPQGVYFLELLSEKEKVVKKFIKE